MLNNLKYQMLLLSSHNNLGLTFYYKISPLFEYYKSYIIHTDLISFSLNRNKLFFIFQKLLWIFPTKKGYAFEKKFNILKIFCYVIFQKLTGPIKLFILIVLIYGRSIKKKIGQTTIMHLSSLIN